MNKTTTSPSERRRPLTVWELPKLLESVHGYRKSKVKNAKDRPHFPAILAFVYRNRFAIASQIQRRFTACLPSDRTARRHLAEMESLGYLDTAPPPSPLWPKTYYVTGRGRTRLRTAYASKGKSWKPTVIDRARSLGYSSHHLLHELSITECLLTVWEYAQNDSDLELLNVQRRSLARHPAFTIGLAGCRTRLIPDGMFLVRQRPGGMMACFAEIDMATMSESQWIAKLRRYENWAISEAGNRWLKDLYASNGATTPRPVFRVVIAAKTRARLEQLTEWSRICNDRLHGRLWFTCVADIEQSATNAIPLKRNSRHQIVH